MTKDSGSRENFRLRKSDMTNQQFEKERRRQIKKLLDVSTPEERRKIRKGLREGWILRKEVEQL